MAILSADIDERILQALGMVFRYELQEKPIAQSDSLALRTLKQLDLQDDPTLAAPYLAYGPDLEKEIRLLSATEEREFGCVEIGGPIRYLHHYRAKFGTPQTTTRESARAQIYTLGKRIRNTLIYYMDLSGVLGEGLLTSEDQSEYIEGQNNRLVTMLHCRIFGGETTFYGAGEIHWHYPVSLNQQSRFFVGG